jgi:hypothetical protein
MLVALFFSQNYQKGDNNEKAMDYFAQFFDIDASIR